tara:strand:+ start:813 stop:1217 length:405 start_codon:yes stop_codon:yes gene_type:complete
MPKKREAIVGKDFMRHYRQKKELFSNNAWRAPRGVKPQDFNNYVHRNLKCTRRDNYVVGWKPNMTNREVAKLFGKTKSECFKRGKSVMRKIMYLGTPKKKIWATPRKVKSHVAPPTTPMRTPRKRVATRRLIET